MSNRDQRKQSFSSAQKGGSETDRRLPQSLEAEKCLLGSLLLNPQLLSDVSSIIGDGDGIFYNEAHWVIYATMLEMESAGKSIDIATVTQKLAGQNQLENVGGAVFVTKLTMDVPTAANWKFYLDIIESRAKLRQIISAGEQMVQEAYETQDEKLADFIDGVDATISKITAHRNADTQLKGPREIAEIGYRVIEDMIRAKGKPQGLTTDWPDLDDITGGWRDGELILVAAETSGGKTSLAMNIAEHLSVLTENTVPVGIFSQEMTIEELSARTICSVSEVSRDRVRKGLVTTEEAKKIEHAADRIAKSKLYIDDEGSLSISKLRSKCRRMVKKHGIKLFVVDYIQLMHGGGTRFDNAVKELEFISHGIKSLAKELHVPIIVISQFNRGAADAEKPRLSDLKGASALEQDADIVILLKPDPTVAEEEEIVTVIVWVKKNRNGRRGKLQMTLRRDIIRFFGNAKIDTEDEPPREDQRYPD